MRTIGIKLADGSFYPVLKEGTNKEVVLNLTTANNNQTKVMVDLYRSKTDSMDDAEYVDSLQIENLNEHPNGEPDIAFSVYLDENNELHAKMVDSETGAQSNSTITLVSRTLEERLVPADDTITGAEINSPEDEFTLGDPTAFADTPTEEAFSDTLDETPADQAFTDPAADSFDIPADIETAPAEEPIFEETAVATDEVETPAEENFSDALADTPAADDFSDESFSDALADTPADQVITDDTLADDTLAQDAAAPIESPSVASQFVEDDLTSFGGEAAHEAQSDLQDFFGNIDETDAAASEATDDSFEAQTTDVATDDSFEAPTADETIADSFEAPTADETISDESFEMPDLDETITDTSFDAPDAGEAIADSFEAPTADDTIADSFDAPAANDTIADSFDIPDTDDTINDSFDAPIEETTPDFGEMPDFGDISADLDDPTAGFGDDTDLGDLDFDAPVESAPAGRSEHDDFFGIGDDDVAPSAGGISFTGLYDKETDFDDADSSDAQKTKTPMIICVICAIICLIAVALLLFVLPSKYNLIANGTIKHNQKTEKVAEEPVPVAEPAPVVEVEPIPAAKEDEVIIIEKAEEVIPLPPPVAEEVPGDIQYRIKWGDTLWDISDTYYKNPWRYKFLAKYNNIKNPDYIISGTIITIPAE